MFLPRACQALFRLRLLRLACLLVTPGAGFGRGIAVAGLLFHRPLHRRRRVLHALLPIGAGGVGLFIAAVAAARRAAHGCRNEKGKSNPPHGSLLL